MARICPNCGHENELDARFCRFCGHPLPGTEGEPLPRREFTISVPMDIFHPELVATAIAWYMVVSALLSLLGGFVLTFLWGFLQGFGEQIGRISEELMGSLPPSLGQASIRSMLLGWVFLLLGVFEGASATGLFRCRRWAISLTKLMVILETVEWFVSLLLVPASSTGLGTFIAVVIAVVVWVLLGRPRVREYFQD